MTLQEGDRVQVKEEHDETLRLLGMRTTPGTVDTVYGPDVMVNLDSGQAVPYPIEQLDRV